MSLLSGIRKRKTKKNSTSSSKRADRAKRSEKSKRSEKAKSSSKRSAQSSKSRSDRSTVSKEARKPRSRAESERSERMSERLAESYQGKGKPEATIPETDMKTRTAIESTIEQKDGKDVVNGTRFAQTVQDQIKENPEKLPQLMNTYPEAFDSLAKQLPDLEEGDKFYHSLANTTQKLGPSGPRKQVADWIAQRPQLKNDPKLITGLARAAVDGKSSLNDALKEALPADDRRQKGLENVTTAGKAVRQFRRGSVKDGEIGTEHLQDLAGLPRNISKEALAKIEPQLSDRLSRLEEYSQGGEDHAGEASAFITELSDLTAKAEDPELTEKVANSVQKFAKEGSDDITKASNAQIVAQGFEDQIRDGGEATLGLEVVEKLSKNHDLDGSFLSPTEVVTDGVSKGLNDLYGDLKERTEQVAQLDLDLAELHLNTRGTMTDDQLDQATKEFRENNSEYAALEEIAGGGVKNLEHLHRLQGLLSDDDSVIPISAGERGRLDESVETSEVSVARSLRSDSGQKAVGTLLLREGRGEDTWLTDREKYFKTDELRDSVSSGVMNAIYGQTAQASFDGNAEVAKDHIAAFEESGLLSETGVVNSAAVADSLAEIVDATTSGAGAEAINAATQKLDDLTVGSGGAAASGKGVGTLRSFGGVLGLAGLAYGTKNFIDDPSARGALDLATNGTGLTTAQLGRFFSNSALKTAGNIAGGVGVALGAVDTLNALEDEDYSQAALSLAGTIGGGLLLAGASGPGAVVVIGAAVGSIALGQYRKTEFENRHESENTAIFLRHSLSNSGLSDHRKEEAIKKLYNADGDGRLTGVLIEQAAGEIPGIDKDTLLNIIARQPTDVIEDIIVRGHGVDPQKADDLESLKRSEVKEWVNFLREKGLELPQAA